MKDQWLAPDGTIPQHSSAMPPKGTFIFSSDPNAGCFTFAQRPLTWKWDFLGDGRSLVVVMDRDVSWFKRMACRFFFGSKWTDMRSPSAAPSEDKK